MFAPVPATVASRLASAARPVGDAREHHQPAAGLGLVAARDRGQQAGVDVAAGEHRDGDAVAGGLDLAAQQRGDADRARALDHELAALEQERHRLGGRVLADDHELVGELASGSAA